MKLIPNILLNASFEIEDDGDDVPDGWLSTGSPAQGTADVPVHGSYHAVVPSGDTLKQTRDALASTNYVFAIKVKGDYDISITEYDAGGTPTAVIANDTDTEAAWAWYTHTWTTEADTVSIRITLEAGVGDCSYDCAALGYYTAEVDPLDLDPAPFSYEATDEAIVTPVATMGGVRSLNTPIGPIGGLNPIVMSFQYLTAAQRNFYRQFKGRQVLVEDHDSTVYYAIIQRVPFAIFSQLDTAHYRTTVEMVEVGA